MQSNWRKYARKVIYKVLEETNGQTEKEITKALREAYPFGERARHPYKIWLDEIKVQRKQKRFGVRNNVTPKEQGKLFSE